MPSPETGSPAREAAQPTVEPGSSSGGSSSSSPASSRFGPFKRLVVCLDGTGNTFGTDGITNIPTLFSLATEDPDKQLIYYQIGIGQSISTHDSSFAPKKIYAKLAATVDKAIGFSLGQHICGAYRFLMDHWREGDEIFLFGFSRGAYTARALAGMLQLVGLLPVGNEDSIPLAFSIYKRQADAAFTPFETLAHAFKRTFSRHVNVHFVGVWDTVASVGAIIPRTLPFPSVAAETYVFRHALALDEARARYCPQLWVGDPGPGCIASDVKEVWFSGAHSNVGGGDFLDPEWTPALSHLSLRWMLREAVEAGFEVDPIALWHSVLFQEFVDDAHRMLGSASRGDDEALEAYLRRARAQNRDLDEVTAAAVFLAARCSPETTKTALSPSANHLSFKLELPPSWDPRKCEHRGVKDRRADWWSRFGTRVKAAGWWVLEILPTVKLTWDAEGNEEKWSVRPNIGRGRRLPPSPSFRYSVKERLDEHDPAAFGPGNNENYPDRGRYQIKARFSKGQGIDDAKWAE